MQISINIIDILCLHIFFLDPFEFPYYFYCILGELIYVYKYNKSNTGIRTDPKENM